MARTNRRSDELRPIEIQRGFTDAAPGSVLLRCGRTHVLCTASIEVGVPKWRAGRGLGWLTSEYDMLPGSSPQRKERNRAKVDGRTQEIQRLIGRSLRAALDLALIGENTIYLDCDVLQADGGTRTASVTGAYVALCDALRTGAGRGLWPAAADAAVTPVAAVSVGIVDGTILLDLDYAEDSSAEVDANLVQTGDGRWIEVQASAEKQPFTDQQLAGMLAVGRAGLAALFAAQRRALASS